MKILAVREQKDGSALIDIGFNDEDRRIIKFLTGVKRLTDKKIKEFCETAIREYVDKEVLEDVNEEIHKYRKEKRRKKR